MPKLTVAILAFALTCPRGLLAQNDLNHVQWRFEVSPQSAASGGEVFGKLTGTIDSGWHLYSITTPPGPIPTTIKLADSPGSNLTIYQPKPERKFDPNFNADTETYTGKVIFVLKVNAAKRTATGCRTGGDAALSGVQRDAMHSSGHQAGFCKTHSWLPERRSQRCRFRRATAKRKPGRAIHGRRAGHVAAGVSWRRVRLWTRLHLHALRVSHDPDHHVVLPEQTGRIEGDHRDAGGDFLCRHRRAVHRSGIDCDLHPRTVRSGATWLECLGERRDRRGVSGVRSEPAGCV